MKSSFINDYKRFFKLIDKRKTIYMLSNIYASLTWAVSILIDSYAIKTIIDFFVYNDKSLLINAIVIVVLKIIISGILNPLTMNYALKQQEIIMRNIRKRAFAHLQKLPVSYFSNKHSGEVLVKINTDVESLRIALASVQKFMTILISIIMAIPYFMYLDIRLSSVAIIMGFTFMIVTLTILNPMRKANKNIRDHINKMSKNVTENVSGFNVIRMFNLEKVFKNKLTKNLDDLYTQQKKYSRLEGFLGFAGIFIWRAGSTTIASLGAWFAINKTIEIGSLVATINITSSIIRYIIEMGQLPAQLQKAFVGTERLYELFETKPEPQYYKHILGYNKNAALDLKNIYFSYDDKISVINNLSLSVNKGQTIALVGNSGGGKSTLIKIILGLYCPSSGEISINGKGLNTYRLSDLRKLFAYVPQNAYIFNGTIRENILYGNPDATEEAIYKAAKQANAHEFILEKPQGYESIVGERGIKLSGGERQRIAIARAIIKNAPFLLLDEATSSLDNESEALIQKALENLLQDKTSVVVAHRLSTIKRADIIYYISDGEVLEKGTHKELVELKGKYAELYFKTFAIKTMI